MQDALASLVPALLQASPLVSSVELCGSRALGTAGRYSDWDFRVSTQDFAAFAPQLPGLVCALDPVVQQWDRLSDEACYMLIVTGPTKIDLIFPDVPHDLEPPWVVDASTLSRIDDHFWDQVLWLTSKVDAGKDSFVEADLTTMHERLLAPMGIPARDVCAQRLGVVVDRRVEHAVVPIVQAVCGHVARKTTM